MPWRTCIMDKNYHFTLPLLVFSCPWDIQLQPENYFFVCLKRQLAIMQNFKFCPASFTVKLSANTEELKNYYYAKPLFRWKKKEEKRYCRKGKKIPRYLRYSIFTLSFMALKSCFLRTVKKKFSFKREITRVEKLIGNGSHLKFCLKWLH